MKIKIVINHFAFLLFNTFKLIILWSDGSVLSFSYLRKHSISGLWYNQWNFVAK